jgi:hypothetical protein
VPDEVQLQECREFLVAQAERFRADPDPKWQERVGTSPEAPAVRALASLCHMLMSSNGFLYAD